MAYATGSATSLGDLLSKLSTFATTTDGNWVEDELDDGVTTASRGIFALHHSTYTDLYISMKWVANAPGNLSIHHALGYTGGTLPGLHTDDSGNGYNNAFGSDANLDDERCVNTIGDGPFESYHFFSDAAGTYIHVVVETETEVFRHFGFGQLEKFNDWTGGGYCYGHYQEVSTNSQPVDTGTWLMLDGIQGAVNATSRRSATIHAEGLPHQGASEKWLQHSGGVTANSSKANWVDTAGNDKQISFGGMRGGPIAWLYGNWTGDISTGHVPMYPQAIFTYDYTNDFGYFLGSMPDVRGIDMFSFSPGQEVTVGSETWILFPQSRKTTDLVLNRTWYAGVAYKKVT